MADIRKDEVVVITPRKTHMTQEMWEILVEKRKLRDRPVTAMEVKNLFPERFAQW